MTLVGTRQDWFGNIRGDILSGLVVALALIPEAIAFSIIAGVDPKVGLYASFTIAVVIAFAGGRPAMISAATGAMALVIVDLVKDHGVEYLMAVAILTGVIQVLFGFFKIANYMRFVSTSVMTGFVNALAILYIIAQVQEMMDVTLISYPMVIVGLIVIYGFPRITKSIPSPLIAVLVLTIAAVTFNIDVRTVSDKGELPSSLPSFLIPDVPLNLDTLMILLPYAIPLAIVGLLESLMTAQILDDFTDTTSDKHRESKGQGIANVVTGFFGGMPGCAMIGQSVINVRTGGRGRLSTLIAGVVLIILVVGLGDWVGRIPMPALVAVMIMVAIGTFNWRSIGDLRRHPRTSSVVMLSTVAVVVATNNLAYGVLVGVLLSGVFFAWKISQLFTVSSEITDDGRSRTYVVSGQVFFASADKFADAFDFREALETVTIDLSRAHFWDISAVGALDKVILRFQRDGTEITILGMNEASRTAVDRLGAIENFKGIELQPRN